jgi:peptidylprolyl isomerase
MLRLAFALCPLAYGACEKSAPPAAPPPAPMSVAPPADAAGPATPPMFIWKPPADVSMPPADAERDPSGLARKVLTPGKGSAHPTPDDYVDLKYAGWERNGRQFEGMAPDNDPRRFDQKDLTPGLQQELQRMTEGEKRRIWVPAALAYAKRTDFANAPKGDMTYEVELVRIIPRPAVPADVKAAPKGAKTTKSGVQYVVLAKGKGKRNPVDETRADVIYTGWTPDGKQFQASVAGSDKVTIRVKLLPPGWREAMKMMVEGDKWRLWIPGKLAFGEIQPGAELLPFGPPPGPVTYDVELIKIVE